MIKNIKFSNLVMILIIGVTLLCLSPNIYARDNARVFNPGFTRTHAEDSELARQGFAKLSYNVSYEGNPTKSNILSWTNDGGSSYNYYNYAFYTNTLGPSDTEAANGSIYFFDNYRNTITPGEIAGAWHFVYIDASNSKRDNSFPDSLNITGRSQRAYIGWATYVDPDNTNLFNRHFWGEYILNYPIHQATLKASADVPGANTTPSRFAGDSSWYGVGG